MALELPYSMQWISEMTIAMIVLLIVLLVFISSQNNISTTINQNQPDQYRKAIVMENLLSTKADRRNLDSVSRYSVDYYDRRGYLPIDYFTQNPDSDIQYATNNGHCYVQDTDGSPLIPALDGENFAYMIEPLPSIDEDAHVSSSYMTVSNTDCAISQLGGGTPTNGGINYLPTDNFRSSALLHRGSSKPSLPVRLYIYRVP